MELVRKRNFFVAGLFSFLVPGLGQLYNGQIRKCLIIFSLYFGPLLISVFIPWEKLLFEFRGFVFFISFFLMVLSIYLFSIIESVWQSIKIKEIKVGSYNNKIIYIFSIVAFVFFINPHLLPFKKDFSLGTYKIVSEGMAPTLFEGDMLFANMNHYNLKKPLRGDVAVFVPPNDESKIYIQRIVGLPGETIEIQNKRVLINGHHLDENYIQRIDSTIRPKDKRDNIAPYEIPDGKYFMLGDNRDASLDSRYWGVLDASSLKSKALFLYYSKTFRRIGNKII